MARGRHNVPRATTQSTRAASHIPRESTQPARAATQPPSEASQAKPSRPLVASRATAKQEGKAPARAV
ncbi:hypothetical protein M5689_021034 [Euphorbia peplus]|nr:hypothetical protein M5689_021034 [Euphorbia peplus]